VELLHQKVNRLYWNTDDGVFFVPVNVVELLHQENAAFYFAFILRIFRHNNQYLVNDIPFSLLLKNRFLIYSIHYL